MLTRIAWAFTYTRRQGVWRYLNERKLSKFTLLLFCAVGKEITNQLKTYIMEQEVIIVASNESSNEASIILTVNIERLFIDIVKLILDRAIQEGEIWKNVNSDNILTLISIKDSTSILPESSCVKIPIKNTKQLGILCRLKFDPSEKMHFSFYDDEGNLCDHEITCLKEIEGYADKIVARVKKYLG